MLESIADIQALIIGATLLWSGVWKAFIPRSGEIAVRSALLVLFRRERITKTVYRLLGIAEIAAALLLLAPPYLWWKMGLGVLLATVFLAYLFFSVRAAPGKPCACMGGREVAVSWRTFARTGLLLSFSLIGLMAHDSWLTTIFTNPWYSGIVILEGFLILALSPDLNWIWTHPLTPTRQVDCATARVPLSQTLEQLRASSAFQGLSKYLTSDLSDHWREACWRFLCFEAQYEGRKATAIFAVPILPQPQRIRAVVMSEIDDTIYLTVGPPILENRSS